MNKNFFSNYDFQETKGFKSLTEQLNVEYNEGPEANKIETSKERFSSYDFDDIHPLVTPIMGKNSSEDITTDATEIDWNGTIELATNVLAQTPISIEENQATTVLLNGRQITAGKFTENNGNITEGDTDSYVFWVKKGGYLNIDGDGEVRSDDATYSMAVWAKGGKVDIYGGKYYNSGDGCDLIYASEGAEVNIYGGEFHATKRSGEVPGTKNEYSALNLKDNSNSKITVFGGTFYGFNPANNVSEGPNTNFVAEGYQSIEIEPNVWQVVSE